MKRLILVAALSTLVLAKPKPETYKETEDFQYSRSSSDDGSKSGFYGAQRGNMGGNYERAHNMDSLAQHQMSGLVRQVDGELGDGAKLRTGSVYTAANSRGIYGSGNYDLRNLEGRNFAEGESFGNSQSHSSSSSQNSRYRGHTYSGMESKAGLSSSHSQDARYSGYQTSSHTDQRQIDNLQAVDTSQDLGRYDSSNQAGYDMKYYRQSGSHRQSEFDQSSANLQSSSGYDGNSQAHYITTPVRVVVRPGGRVAIPIAVPTYAVSQNVVSDNNGINSEAEVLNQQTGSIPTNKVKHYESSYSYRKQWEKHHAIPGDVSIVVPTENPYPKNSELYEDAQSLQSSKNQLQNANSQTVQSGDHRAYSKSVSNRSRFQAGYNSQQSSSDFDTQQSHLGINSQQSQSGFNTHQDHEAFGTGANAYDRNSQTSGMAADLTNAAGDVNSKPKSYHSSYSYHKSWERQGDPYVIKPVGGVYDGQTSEKLTAGSSNSAAYSSHQYGSHSKQAHQSYSADCDDQGHVRVARSYNSDQELQQDQNQWENLGQQTQSKFENLEDLGQQQQNKWDNLQDLGQQSQNQWDNLQQLGQETGNQWDNLQQLGQQTQNQWGNLQQLGQQSQNQWDQLQQLGQQAQDKWENLEDLGQQTQRGLEQHQNQNLEDLSQQSQNEDVLTNFEQKENPLTNFEQQANNQHEKIEQITQQTQNEDVFRNFEQQVNNQNENLDIFNQHNQNQLTNFEQQANNQNQNIEPITQNKQNEDVLTNFEQQATNENENLNQHNQNPFNNFEQSNTQKENPTFQEVTGFEPHPSIDFLHQHLQSEINNQNKNIQNLFDQNQQNIWYQHNANVDKNIYPNDFMKPISQSSDDSNKNLQDHEVDESITGNGKPNLFSSPSINTEYNKDWFQNSEQHAWHTYNQQTNVEYEHNFWHNFENNKDFVDNSPPSSFSTSDSGHPLRSLWDKIDNIGGGITVAEGKTGDKQLTSHDYSQNVNNDQNGYGWTDIDTESTDKKIEHKNLFDEQLQKATTTDLPMLLPHHSSQPADNVNTSISEQKIINVNENVHSQDEGRGDIGPEDTPLKITTSDKPYKTPQEIEILSLSKDAPTPKESDVIIQPSSIRNKHENISNELLVTNLDQQKTIDENTQNSFNTGKLQASTTIVIPIVEMTTVKSNIHNEQPTNRPIVHVINLYNNTVPYLQKQEPHQQTSEDIQQQNVQQTEDFGQLQSSWFQSSNLQQGYDQQNVEQQFEDFQQHEYQPDQKYLPDFGQYVQHPLPPPGSIHNEEVEQGNPRLYHTTIGLNSYNNLEQQFQPSISSQDTSINKQLMEPIHASHITDINSKNQNLVDNEKAENTKLEDIPAPVEVTTAKPGFWKSLGNKFTNAKDKVYSWFSSS